MTLNEKLETLVGSVVSVLIDINRNETLKESYSGILELVGDDFICVDLNNPKFYIKKVNLKKDIVLSVWEYNGKYNK